MDQTAILTKGSTIRMVLQTAFDELFEMESRMNQLYMDMADESISEAQMDEMMSEAGSLADVLNAHDFYMIDAKIDEVSRALGLYDLGLDRDVVDLSGGQRTKVITSQTLITKARHLTLR